jgi:hypothetical protein
MAIDVTKIIVEPMTVTFDGTDLGAIEGDIEIGFEEKTVDIKSHQTGDVVLDSIRTGRAIKEMKLTLKETSVAQLKSAFAAYGTLTTPTSGTEVIGIGLDKLFSSVSGDAAKLVLHPVGAGATKTRDWAFWLALPMVESIKFSGEKEETCSVTFKIYPDLTKPENVQYAVFGDHTQTFV